MSQGGGIFDDLLSIDNNRDQAIKTNTITGNRFVIHSLPKEFQDWHNIYYILEKEAKIDKRAVSDAILNGYMWKAITDGTEYGIAAFLLVMWSAIKLKLAFGIATMIIVGLIIFAGFLFIAYHTVFYAMIRAQIIGEVTKKAAIYTAGAYFSSFWGVFLSLGIVFLFFVTIAEDIAPIIARLIIMYHEKFNTGSSDIFFWIEQLLIAIHNLFVYLGIQGEQWYNNIYVIYIAITLFGSAIILIFDKFFFDKFRKRVYSELVDINRKKYYPIQIAQKIMHEWKVMNHVN